MMLFILLCGCNNDKPLSKVELKPAALKLEVKVKSFDTDLFGCAMIENNSCVSELKKSYGNFFCGFVEEDIRIAACASDSTGILLQMFVSDPQIAETHRAVDAEFPTEKRKVIAEDLVHAMRRWHHFFPDSLVPGIVFYQSAWNRSIATTDSAIGIALDCYLGPEHAITGKLSPDLFPNYIKQNMDQQYIHADAVKGFAAWKSRGYYRQKDLLSELIFYGKVMYLAEALAPDLADSTLMSWSSGQYNWIAKNEAMVWKTMANEKVMYRSKPFEINKWFADGPFTTAADIPQESPPQLGVWIGWNIVRQYMTKNPNVTLPDLLQENDFQKILAGYVPAKS